MVGEETTQSVLDPTQPLRIVRSHRRPKRTNTKMRAIGIAVATALALGGMVPLSEASQRVVVADASVAAPESVEVRGSTVNRSIRSTATRAQKIEKVIAYAMAQRGDRYSWGASGPSRWDCSGLVSVAFKKGAGKRLPHFTGGIQKLGTKVSRKNLKRGDIVFPQHGHVGIYLGGGKMVHASSGKGRVIVASVYGFYTARRII